MQKEGITEVDKLGVLKQKTVLEILTVWIWISPQLSGKVIHTKIMQATSNASLQVKLCRNLE